MIHLEKHDPARNQRRYYALALCPTLFGGWTVLREWGRLGSRGGRVRLDPHDSAADAEAALARLKRQKERRGYVSTGVQRALPL